jgi:hypothetical protein
LDHKFNFKRSPSTIYIYIVHLRELIRNAAALDKVKPLIITVSQFAYFISVGLLISSNFVYVDCVSDMLINKYRLLAIQS